MYNTETFHYNLVKYFFWRISHPVFYGDLVYPNENLLQYSIIFYSKI